MSTPVPALGEAADLELLPLELAQTPGLLSVGYERSPFGMSITSARPETFGIYVTANLAYCSITGYSLAKLRGMHFQELCHPDDYPAARDSLDQLIAGKTQGVDATVRLVRQDGSIEWVRQHRSLVRDASGLPLHFLTHTESVSERRANDAALIEAQRRFRSAFDNAPIGITIANADRSNGDRYIEVNRAFCDMTGYTTEQLLELSFVDITHPEDRTANGELWASLLAGDIPTYQLEKRYVRADGRVIWVLVNTSLSHDAYGKPLHKITQIVDISDRKRYEEQLQHLAHYDSLTGLLNRHHFNNELDKQISRVRRNRTTMAVALIDLDNFKYVNDTLGHAAGDELLCRVADILKARCRSTDVLARLGGDEFAVILRDVGAAQANRIANDMRTAICADEMLADMRSMHVSASIGVAFVDHGKFANARDVLVGADIAMYDAKKAGRNRVSLTLSVHEPRAQMRARVDWVGRIRAALREDRFMLLAQPIMNLTTNAVECHELLLRMLDESGEVVLPSEFLATAEHFGLVGEINKWVVRRAISALQGEYGRSSQVRFSISISATSIIDTNVFDFIQSELQCASYVAPSSLMFEIKGVTAETNIYELRDVTERLRELGCAFSLGDFGAGLKSCACLKQLGFEAIKIDSGLIVAMRDSASDRAMVEAIVQIVKCLGKQTIAEFVDDERTLAIAREIGVSCAQGPHVGSARPLSEVSYVL